MLPPGTVVLMSSGPSEIVAETSFDEKCVVYSDRMSDVEVGNTPFVSTSSIEELDITSSEKALEYPTDVIDRSLIVMLFSEELVIGDADDSSEVEGLEKADELMSIIELLLSSADVDRDT